MMCVVANLVIQMRKSPKVRFVHLDLIKVTKRSFH